MSGPNILFVTCHDLGDYLGCYGTPVSTPNLDALAAEGVIFDNHFSTGTHCAPSRGSIMTGCYPHTHGLMGNVQWGWELDVEKCTPLPVILGQAGYSTHLFGYQHEHWDPQRLGYQHNHQGETYHCDHVAPVLAEWLRTRRNPSQPFYASVGFRETHRPWKRDIHDPVNPAEVAVRPYVPDLPQIRRDLADLYGAITFMDRAVGDILRALDSVGLREQTLVVFASDHGISMWHSKQTLYDGGTKVAYIMRWPAGLPSGHRVKALTSHVDVLPTILDLLGLPVPGHVEGRSLAPAARKEPGEARAFVFAENNYFPTRFDPARMARSSAFKYIRKGLETNSFDFRLAALANAAADADYREALFSFYPARRCTEELYDLVADPAELVNLADDAAYQAPLGKMRAALDAHLKATNDPFRHLRNELQMPKTVYEREVEANRRHTAFQFDIE